MESQADNIRYDRANADDGHNPELPPPLNHPRRYRFHPQPHRRSSRSQPLEPVQKIV